MIKAKRFERKQDKYGNTIQTIIRYDKEDDIEETKIAYDLKGRITEESRYYARSNQFSLYHYQYEEDVYGNVIKETLFMEDLEIDALGNKNLIRTSQTVWHYQNSYSSEGGLLESSMYDETGELRNTKKYIYEDGLLISEERSNKSNGLYQQIDYQYNQEKELVEKVFRLPSGDVSYYEIYKKIGSHEFSHTLVNPERSKYQWQLTNIDKDSATIDVYEELTTPEVYKEIFEYLVKKHDQVKYVILGGYQTDRGTYAIELNKVLAHYEKVNHIICDYVF